MMTPALQAYPNVRLLTSPPTPARAGQRQFRSNRKGYEQNSFEDYVSTINRQEGQFDLIVIDGRARIACLEASQSRLSDRGIILFDNSDRAEYRRAIDDCPLTEQALKGMTPGLPMPSQTSLLLQKG
jgi:predicted O-methyltransferase YrrM